MALWEIKTRQLWRESGYASFASYCAERHGWAKTYGYDMANCGAVLAALPDSAMAENSAIAENLNECQIRALAKVPEPDRAEVLERAAKNGKVTAKAIRAAVAPAPVEPEREERPRVHSADEELGEGAAEPQAVNGHALRSEPPACPPPDREMTDLESEVARYLRAEAMSLRLTADAIERGEYEFDSLMEVIMNTRKALKRAELLAASKKICAKGL